MKELSIEEKAKRYDKAIEKAKELYPKFKGIIARHVVEELFPELKISEDENIRRGLIQYFNNFNLDTFAGFDPKKILDWLEKLGEQKSKVEAKFKIDDWVVSPNGVYWHIDAIRDGRYKVSSDSGGSADWPLDTNIYHKFTIQDAKDGDVLHSPSHHLIWIYKDNEHYYACVNMNYVTKDIATNGLIIIPNDACPANKDEQTILFTKMKEADYEWDAEKKELKEIEHKNFCELDNSCACVKFPFKAKVKSTGTIVAIHGGQLSYDGKEWIKYQSDAEDGYKIYEPNDLELVCEIEQKSAKFREGDNIQFKGVGHNRYTIREVCGLSHYINTNGKRMDMSYTDANFEVIKDSDLD